MADYKFCNVRIAGLAVALPANDANRSVSEQTASDLAFLAANRILDQTKVNLDDIACLLFSTLSPDYRSPATAAVLQHRLNLPVDCIVYDIVIGGTAFNTLITAGASILKSTNKRFALLLFGNTMSKMTSPELFASMRFSDNGGAILLERTDDNKDVINIRQLVFSDALSAIIHKEGAYRSFAQSGSLSRDFYLGKDVSDQLSIDQPQVNCFLENEVVKQVISFTNELNIDTSCLDVISLPCLAGSLNQSSASGAEWLIPKSRNTDGQPCFFGSDSAMDILSSDKNANELESLIVEFGEGLSLSVSHLNIPSQSIYPIIKSDSFFKDGAVSHVF